LLILSLVAAAFPWTGSPALADAPVVVHEPFPLVQPRTFTGACAFPVQQIVTGNREAVTIRVDPDGTQYLQIRGIAQVQVINVNTGKSLDFTLSIPDDITVHPDGSQTLVFTGQTLLFFYLVPGGPPPPPSILPGAFLTHGRAVAELDPQGHVLSFTTTGQT